MVNPVLKEIAKFARVKLLAAYGCCSAADGDEGAILNATDDDGNDIVITLAVEVGSKPVEPE